VGIVRRLIQLSVIAGIVYALTFTWNLIFTITFENPTESPKADVIVCLGGGAGVDGILLNSSIVRAEACADLYLKGAAPVVLFTGAHADPRLPSVAQNMADIAIDLGVPQEAIMVEEQSRSTLQNAVYTQPFLRESESVILVTQGFHLQRSKFSYQAIGPWKISLWMAAPFDRYPDGSINWQAMYREALAVWFNLVRFGLWRVAKRVGLNDIDWILI